MKEIFQIIWNSKVIRGTLTVIATPFVLLSVIAGIFALPTILLSLLSIPFYVLMILGHLISGQPTADQMYRQEIQLREMIKEIEESRFIEETPASTD